MRRGGQIGDGRPRQLRWCTAVPVRPPVQHRSVQRGQRVVATRRQLDDRAQRHGLVVLSNSDRAQHAECGGGHPRVECGRPDRHGTGPDRRRPSSRCTSGPARRSPSHCATRCSRVACSPRTGRAAPRLPRRPAVALSSCPVGSAEAVQGAGGGFGSAGSSNPSSARETSIRTRPDAQPLAESDPAHRLGDGGRTDGDVPGKLRPRRQRAADLDQRGRAAVGQPARVDDAQHMGHLVGAAQARQLSDADIAEQPVQDGPFRLEVVSLDVDQAAVTAGHQDRNTACACRLPQ